MIEIRNSHFRKKEYRYIHDMYTDQPYLEPQYYSLVMPEGGASMISGNFTFDGQIFSRSKKQGGNMPSGWSVTGKNGVRHEKNRTFES